MGTSSRLHLFEKKAIGHAIKINYIALPIVESEIYSMLILYKRVWD